MVLVRLIYTSKISQGFGDSDIASILEAARANNRKKSITGLLCFSRKIFLQCLEGSRATVNSTYQCILKDNRHENPLLLDYRDISERGFADWSMGYIPESSLTTSLNLKYSAKDVFDPYEMTGESAHRLLIDLKSTVPTQV